MAKKKRKIPYSKIVDALWCCFGGERKCWDCPYDSYNDKDDLFGDVPMLCIEKFQKDAKRWADEMCGFCHCEDCVCWHRDYDEEHAWHPEWDGKEGFCSTWNRVMLGEEFCSRGARND